MKNKTYYLGKMKYHKRSSDFELSYVVESNIKHFSFNTNYKEKQEKVADKSYFDAYIVKMDELNLEQYMLFLKTLTGKKMYFLGIDADTANLLLAGDFETPHIGDKSKFILEFSSVRVLDQINN